MSHCSLALGLVAAAAEGVAVKAQSYAKERGEVKEVQVLAGHCNLYAGMIRYILRHIPEMGALNAD